MKKLYCDIAATTPVDPKVIEIMNHVHAETFGNPSSIHKYGQESRAIIERARLQISDALHCENSEIIFTGCGSESNNFAIQGLLTPGDHIITSAYEHPAVLKVVESLVSQNISFSLATPNSKGVIEPESIKTLIKDNTKMISIMAVNNELGTINDIEKLSAIAHEHNIIFHTDMVQMFGKLPINLNDLYVDMASFSAHKLYGPKGVGALFVRTGITLPAIIHGGGQEKGLRPGTENIAGIAGFGLTASLNSTKIEKNMSNILELESYFISKLDDYKIDHTINGVPRVPGIINISFHGVDASALVMKLDLEGIAISAGSACSSGVSKPSSIYTLLGISTETASQTVRISFGKHHQKSDIDYLIKMLSNIISNLKITQPIHV